ncbi:hypothetical protein DNTS_018303, partial [Danionella cerebrum]
MNIFRLSGDICHLIAIVILLLKIWRSKSCAGGGAAWLEDENPCVRMQWISGKSQVLFALVFTTRYLDLFTSFISVYNTLMKLVFLALSFSTVGLIFLRFRDSYDSENDSFRVEFLLIPVGALSLVENYAFTPLEVLWTFSIYLEAVSILPQLLLIAHSRVCECITSHYLFFLGLYRGEGELLRAASCWTESWSEPPPPFSFSGLYLLNWLWRYHTESFFDRIAVVSGVVQTLFYCDFFYLYCTTVLRGSGKMSLPMPVADREKHIACSVQRRRVFLCLCSALRPSLMAPPTAMATVQPPELLDLQRSAGQPRAQTPPRLLSPPPQIDPPPWSPSSDPEFYLLTPPTLLLLSSQDVHVLFDLVLRWTKTFTIWNAPPFGHTLASLGMALPFSHTPCRS